MEHRHRPPHITDSERWYHVTAAVRGRRPLFCGDERKALLRDNLREKMARFDMTLRAWVILDDHYHLLCRFTPSGYLPRFVAQLHGASAHALNKLDGTQGRQVWQNYFDRCIRDEMELWTGFNYIHQNPVKHGYVTRMEEWGFSSYGFWLGKMGDEWMSDCLMQYPIVDFSMPEKGG